MTRVSAAGVFLADRRGVNDEPLCIMKLPLLKGQQWEFQREFQDGGRSSITGTTGPIERVRVPAGNFAAIRIEHVIRIESCLIKAELSSKCWYADGVGLVKAGEHKVLKSFTPGKD